MKGTPSLFEPLRLGGLTLANRIAVSPMCQYSAENGAANDWHLQHLGSLSLSGAGLVIVEQTAVEPPGRISHGCLGLYSDANEAALARVVGFCRRAGSAALGIQLAHAGRKGSAKLPWEGGGPLPPEADAWTTAAPSAITAGRRHADTSCPSTSTEHAPHTPTLQPSFVPVMPRSSRSTCKSKRFEGTVTLRGWPFTVNWRVCSLTTAPPYNGAALRCPRALPRCVA